MTLPDYLLIIISVFLIINVLLLQTDEDGMNSFTGVASEQYKNRKMQGAELFLNRSLFFLTAFYVVAVLWSNSIDRLFM